MSFEQNVENVLSTDESRIELLCESGCVTLHERDWNINRQNQVIKIICTDLYNLCIISYNTPYIMHSGQILFIFIA